jgi:hypothetical protein
VGHRYKRKIKYYIQYKGESLRDSIFLHSTHYNSIYLARIDVNFVHDEPVYYKVVDSEGTVYFEGYSSKKKIPYSTD